LAPYCLAGKCSGVNDKKGFKFMNKLLHFTKDEASKRLIQIQLTKILKILSNKDKLVI
jgi:hypothetical protein